MAANALTLSWSGSTGTAPISYQPQFRLTGATPWTPFGSPVTSLTITITGLSASTSYDFEVVATNASGSATSAVVVGLTSSGNAFPAPGSVAGLQNTGSAAPVLSGPQNGSVNTGVNLAIAGITVTDAGATTATLLVACTAGSVTMTQSGTPVAGSGTAQITFSGTFAACQSVVGTLVYAAPATAQTATISVTLTDQASAQNTLQIQIQVTVAAPPVAPNAPTGLVASAATATSMQLNWGASTVGTAPITYQPMVKRTVDPTFAATGAATSGLTATISGLSAQTSYDFRIVATNTAGSATSATATASTTSATISPSAPTGLQVTATTSTSITYTWTVSAGTAPITYQPQFRPTGATVTTKWYESPGQDGSFWRQPFYSGANWITSGPLVTALRNGSHASPTGTVNLIGNYSVPWYIGKTGDPLVQVRLADGSKSINVRIPLGAVIETPTSAFDQSIGGADSTQPYLVWSISGATMRDGSGNTITAVQASGTVITGTYGLTIQDGTGLIMVDAVTTIPGSNNSIGGVQDLELTNLNADPNYVIPHMLAFQLDSTSQVSSGGPIWPLHIIDTSAANTGPIPQGITIGIPASTPRPPGKTRGFYSWWDVLQHFGAQEYNNGGTTATNFMIYSTLSANAALVTDMVNSLSEVMGSVCILNYANGVAGAQYSLATTKGFTPGAVSAFTPPPILDLSPTGGRTIAPSTYGAWFNPDVAYNVTPPIPAGGASGPFVAFGSAISTNSVTITGLTASTSYDLNVIAINSLGQATSSAITTSTGVAGIPTDATGTQARPAQDLLNRFGINTHFGNGLYAAYTPAQAITAIQSIGCTLVRDSDNG